MPSVTPAEARDYLAALKLANDYEIEELRQAPVELKLRQLWSLMSSAHLRGDELERDAEVRLVRERWARLYQALRG